jgi:hypothetical protein
LVRATGEIEGFFIVTNIGAVVLHRKIARANIRIKGHIIQPVDIPAGLITLAFDVDEHRDLADLMNGHSFDSALTALIAETESPVLE